ncbi:MAG: cytidylate kinase-like family protein [candidate division KSB1 bacterium]|nr:cytidylate kinase-like family protein [candidate division KSB1 bacterium]MDZ7276295.1 cytidylate kinase-like family protein [candidate division KSB1 bacterium]MDZ7287752.1 cytidylate kinase-like family protein [candidate division KSB1 bacterium]MDZ7299908.1 cytidylate kinase-like family protein [candidate division KSB1 bacterium]MDZ7308368.1 cytidylate kinase-like family protein [candidate division KSB1 bacterium]
MSKIFHDIPIEKQILKHMHHWEMVRNEWLQQAKSSLQPPPQTFGPYLTISREPGSGGSEIAQRLAERLGWQLYDREIIEAIASRTHVREELVARFDEHHQSAMDTYLRNLFTGQRFDNTQYIRHLSQVVLGVAQFGRVIILGRGANYILPPEAGLRVRVVAPPEVRCRRVMAELHSDEKKAWEMIAEADRQQREFLQHHFHARADDALAYDVTINTAHLDLAAAAEWLLTLAGRKLKALTA